MDFIKKILALFNLTVDDVVTVAKQLFWILVGTGAEFLAQWMSGKDFGIGGVLVGAILALLTRKSIDTPLKKSMGLKI